MTKCLAVFLFLTALCACSQQDKPITVPFSGPARSGPDPRTELERSKRICEAMGREFTLLDSPPNWRFSCESHGANSAGRSERTTPESYCSRKTLGASTEPQSPSEVSALVSSYLGCPSLFSAIDEIYQQEERDEGWATKLEEKIEQTAAARGAKHTTPHGSLQRLLDNMPTPARPTSRTIPSRLRTRGPGAADHHLRPQCGQGQQSQVAVVADPIDNSMV